MHKIIDMATNPSEISMKTIKLNDNFEKKIQQISQYFIQTFNLYSKLFSIIKTDASYYTKPQPLRHPLIFYLGHTATFYINKLLDKGLIKTPINEQFESIFAVGVDEMDWDDLDQTHYDWPSVAKVQEYRDKVKKVVLQTINIIQYNGNKIGWNDDLWIIMMGIEHQRIHLETSAVIIRRLPINQVQQIEQFIECPHSQLERQKVPKVTMQKVPQYHEKCERNKQNIQIYGWDNQFGSKEYHLEQFMAGSMLVSNSQYYQFIEDKGYQNYQYWTDQGKKWLKSTGVKKPIFWINENKKNNQQKQQQQQQQQQKQQQQQQKQKQNIIYKLRTITRIIQMPWDWPVEVNNLQSIAFCKWKSLKQNNQYRLPTQQEYNSLRKLLKIDHLQWQYQSVGNINLQYWFSPNPIDMFKTNSFYGIIGNVWQHTCTPIHPFQNFEIHPNYEDFTTPTFDNRHNIITGGSFISTGNQSSSLSRYAFRRHFHQFAGIRYVSSKNPTIISTKEIDQSDQSVYNAMINHFVDKKSYIAKFLNQIKIILQSSLINKGKCVVIGCSVGSMVLQLSTIFNLSIGIDQTARFFQIATRLIQKNNIKYKDINIDIKNKNYNLNKIKLYQMNAQNPDKNKINDINLLIIDGNCIMKDSINKIILKFKHLIQKKYLSMICIIEIQQYNQIKGNILDKYNFQQMTDIQFIDEKSNKLRTKMRVWIRKGQRQLIELSAKGKTNNINSNNKDNKIQ